jgi:hypothetical protein
MVHLEAIRNSESEVVHSEISPTYGYITRWFIRESEIEPTINYHPHVLSIDTSDASGGDDIAIAIRDITTGAIVAAGNYNETNLITFSEWLVTWFVRFPSLVAIPERRSTGSTIIDYLLLVLSSKGIDPFKRIFNTIVNDKDEHPDRFKEIDRPSYMRSSELIVKYKKHFGFATSGLGMASRTELYSTTLMNAAKYTGSLVRDKKTIDQILGLLEKKGRIDHADGEHDDNVIAWLLGYWFISKAKNLNYYGIDSRDVLSSKQTQRVMEEPHMQYESEQQLYNKEEIDRQLELLAEAKDPYIVMRIEAKIKQLAEQISLEPNEKVALDELINDLKDTRRINALVNQRQGTSFGRFNPYTYSGH